MSPKPSLQEIEQAIERADDIALLKVAENSFGFWNNTDEY